MIGRLTLAALIVLAGGTADAQETGRLETFGADGRPYTTDRYLLSRQRYSGEHSGGYSGQFRLIKRYGGGGYEIEFYDYTAQCSGESKHYAPTLMTFATTEPDKTLAEVKIDSGKHPPAALKNAYNLFFAACHLQFQRFK